MANPSVPERPSKLLAEWFWTDRWIGSSAFLLPLEPRGLYREMLTQAWRRGGKLPNDHEAIKRAVGCTNAEWRRCWPKVERFWRVDGDSLINDTQADVIAETMRAHERAVERGRKGGKARAAAAQSQEQAENKQRITTQHLQDTSKPPSPSPSPTPITQRAELSGDALARVPRVVHPAQRHGLQTLHRGGHHRHVFCSERICVPDFQHEKFVGAIGGAQADERLRAFYAETVARIPDSESIESDPVKFWPPYVTARWPPQSAAVGTRTAALERATAVFVRGGQ